MQQTWTNISTRVMYKATYHKRSLIVAPFWSAPTPEKTNQLFSCKMLRYVRWQLVANFVHLVLIRQTTVHFGRNLPDV